MRPPPLLCLRCRAAACPCQTVRNVPAAAWPAAPYSPPAKSRPWRHAWSSSTRNSGPDHDPQSRQRLRARGRPTARPRRQQISSAGRSRRAAAADPDPAGPRGQGLSQRPQGAGPKGLRRATSPRSSTRAARPASLLQAAREPGLAERHRVHQRHRLDRSALDSLLQRTQDLDTPGDMAGRSRASSW